MIMDWTTLLIVGLCALLPANMLNERIQRWHQMSPVEQNLQRASHGFVMVFCVLAYGYLNGFNETAGTIRYITYANPSDALPGITFFGFFAYGFIRFVFGVRRSVGVRDGILAARALVKLAIGCALLWFGQRASRAAEPPDAFLELSMTIAGAWCVLTGIVRFLLMVINGGVAAREAVSLNIDANEFNWDQPEGRSWWKFWR
jgi:hypothetical protein